MSSLERDTAHPPNTAYVIAGANHYQWFCRQGIAKGWSYCVGLSIRGPGFSEVFNVNVPPG